MFNLRTLTYLVAALALATLGQSARPADSGPDNFLPTSATRHTSFYVGGEYVGEAGKEVMFGQMYVQGWAPPKLARKYPLILFHGLGQTGTNWTGTPDGRPGWVDHFLNQGYAVYVVDQPARGRSSMLVDSGNLQRTTPVPMAQRLFTAPELSKAWPQAEKHSQWPGQGPGKGQRGDPYFEAFYAGIVPSLADNKLSEELVLKASSALLDKVGPAVLLVHSQAGLFGWSIANARPSLVKGIVAVEPSGPPFQNGNPPKRELPWGLTNIPLRYEPPANDPADLQIEQQAAADTGNLVKCWRQKEPARKLVNLTDIPVLVVTAEASYHAPYDHCTAAFLKQAGVPTTFWRLEDLGIKGNGHLMMLEKNNAEIALQLDSWIENTLK